MQCPNCSNTMQEKKRFDVDIDYCPVCKGVWLDKGEIDKIAKAQVDMKKNIIKNIIRTEKIMTIMKMMTVIIIKEEGREDS
ncbi:MAG: zf-TFIIB domain-containing protein [Nitrososphaeraceae archaeon]